MPFMISEHPMHHRPMGGESPGIATFYMSLSDLSFGIGKPWALSYQSDDCDLQAPIGFLVFCGKGFLSLPFLLVRRVPRSLTES
jgi:hypothetical protein